MAIDKPLATPAPAEPTEAVEVLATQEPDASGGVVVQFGTPAKEKPVVGHTDNLAEIMDETELNKLGSDLLAQFDADRLSRLDWEDTYIKGLDLLGLKIETPTEPFPGACGAFHPILTEAAVRFQAQAITEIFPAGGPVRTRIAGKSTDELELQARRIELDMNSLVLEKMPEYRPETERLLFSLALAGSAFRKVYHDSNLARPTAMFVPAEDFVIGNGASDLLSCERYTHVLRRSKTEVKKAQMTGFYREIDLGDPPVIATRIEDKQQSLSGVRPPSLPTLNTDGRYVLLEMYVDLDLPGFEHEEGLPLPYVVTLDQHGGKVLSIRRNYAEGDSLFRRLQHFVSYHYIPGIGFYGLGLIHLVGGLAKGATSLLRQLVDAGTFSNLPGGLKSRTLRIKGDDTPIKPGEWRDVDVPGDDIGKAIKHLPYKEPSMVLYQLMNQLVDEARRIASIADLNVGDMNKQAPVGTTMALLERAMKVMGGIQARLHASMGAEFKMLAGLNVQYQPDYDIDVGVDATLKSKDYDQRIDIIPVSDPNAASQAQRIVAHQAALEQARQAPQIYNMAELHRQGLMILGIKEPEKVIPYTDKMVPTDPVSENQDILSGRAVKAHEYQDHEAHIQVHLAAIRDPKIIELVSQSQMAQAIQGAAEAHIREHIGFAYRRNISKQLGADLPPYGQPLPPEVESDLAPAVAKAAEKVLAKDVAEKQAQEAAEKMQDPVVQQTFEELAIKREELERKKRADAVRAMQTNAQLATRTAIDLKRIKNEKDVADSFVAGDLTKAVIDAKQQDKDIASKEAIEAAKIAASAISQLNKQRDAADSEDSGN